MRKGMLSRLLPPGSGCKQCRAHGRGGMPAEPRHPHTWECAWIHFSPNDRSCARPHCAQGRGQHSGQAT